MSIIGCMIFYCSNGNNCPIRIIVLGGSCTIGVVVLWGTWQRDSSPSGLLSK